MTKFKEGKMSVVRLLKQAMLKKMAASASSRYLKGLLEPVMKAPTLERAVAEAFKVQRQMSPQAWAVWRPYASRTARRILAQPQVLEYSQKRNPVLAMVEHSRRLGEQEGRRSGLEGVLSSIQSRIRSRFGLQRV